MKKLSNNIIVFPNRRQLGAVKVRFAGPAMETVRQIVCRWEIDPTSGRPVRRWYSTDGSSRADLVTQISHVI